MWLFLGTEVLLFAGLFLGYTVYRHFYHEAFHEASRHLDLWAGTTNTIVLITSSLTVALAYHAIKQNKTEACAGAADLHDPLRARLPVHQGDRVPPQVRRRGRCRASSITSTR